MSSQFFENQPNEICSYLCEKVSKGKFLKPEKLQYHSNEGKGKEKWKEREEGKEEKKKQVIVACILYNGVTVVDFSSLRHHLLIHLLAF